MGSDDPVATWDEARLREFAAGALLIARDAHANIAPLPDFLAHHEARETGENRPMSAVYPPDRVAVIRAFWRAVDDPGSEVTLECRVGFANGWRRQRVTIVSLIDLPLVGSVLTRVVDLGPCEEVVPVVEARETSTFHSPTWALSYLTDLGVVQRVDGMVERIFGRPSEEVVGANISDFIYPDDLDAGVTMWIELVRESGCTRTIRQRVVHPNGSHIWVESTVMNRLADPAVGSIICITHDVTERRRAEEELRRDATTDPLTGVANRRTFDDRLAALVEDGGDPLLLYVDVDNFKSVNDAYGHDVGDEVLRIVARRLAGALRPGDLVARYGGDEFVVLCPRAPAGAERHIIDRLEESLCTPVSLGPSTWTPVASIGAVRAEPGERPRDMLRRADAAMYEVKQSKLPHSRTA
jgi:diguanylate cyclase (GGDEF)-like protein/PAS domain S-box-containing protein